MGREGNMRWYNVLFATIGAIAAVVAEVIYRLHLGSYIAILPASIALAIIIQFGVFNVMKIGNSLVEGIILWTCVTSGMRIVATYLIGEQPATGQWLAYGLVVIATFISKLWR